MRAVLDVDADVLFTATGPDPTQVHVYTAGQDGVTQDQHRARPAHRGAVARRRRGLVRVAAAVRPRGAIRRRRRGRGRDRLVRRDPGADPAGDAADRGPPRAALRAAAAAGHRPGSGPALPVLLDPYGGPAAQRVLASRNAYLVSQWFADQGFAVVIIDGRGTPGRGPAWDRLIHYNQSTPNIEDQVDGLAAVAAAHPDLDTSRVAIRGWSHGGYLAALAVLRRPDVFHAAVAGAPVTDERLYDTHYTERYEGHPDEHPEVYEHDSLIADAPNLRRPLHADPRPGRRQRDGGAHAAAVVGAARGRAPAHRAAAVRRDARARQEEVAENLLLLQADFIKRALGLPAG